MYRPQIATCPPTTKPARRCTRLEQFDTGIVAIAADGRLVGVISERDVVRALAWDANPHAAPVMSYATTEVMTAVLDDDTTAVPRRMIKAGVRRLPVVTADGELIGLASMGAPDGAPERPHLGWAGLVLEVEAELVDELAGELCVAVSGKSN